MDDTWQPLEGPHGQESETRRQVLIAAAPRIFTPQIPEDARRLPISVDHDDPRAGKGRRI